MARTVRDTNLESRAARSRLKARKKPYWRSIERGAHLVYYKGKRGVAWCARWYAGDGRYVETCKRLVNACPPDRPLRSGNQTCSRRTR
jgi:hypothetical protein